MRNVVPSHPPGSGETHLRRKWPDRTFSVIQPLVTHPHLRPLSKPRCCHRQRAPLVAPAVSGGIAHRDRCRRAGGAAAGAVPLAGYFHVPLWPTLFRQVEREKPLRRWHFLPVPLCSSLESEIMKRTGDRRRCACVNCRNAPTTQLASEAARSGTSGTTLILLT